MSFCNRVGSWSQSDRLTLTGNEIYGHLHRPTGSSFGFFASLRGFLPVEASVHCRATFLPCSRSYHSGSVIAREFSDQNKARVLATLIPRKAADDRQRVKGAEMNEATHSASLQKAATGD